MFKKYSYLTNDIYDYKYANYEDSNIIENFINNSQENNDIKYFYTDEGNGEFNFSGIDAKYIKIVVFEWNENISAKFDVFVDREIQNTPEDKRDYSSVLNNDAIGTGNAQSKLDSENAWTSANNTESEWMSINLGEVKKITGIRISKKDGTSYVKKFAIHYSVDNEKYSYIRLESDSNARKYRFVANGCPTHDYKLENIEEKDDETFDTCALKCNQNRESHYFDISGCTRDDFDPKCKGICNIHLSNMVNINENCDSSGNIKTFYKLKSELSNEDVFNVNEYLVSPNGKLFLVMHNTGNLVLYNQFNFIPENIIWKSTEEKEVGDYYCKMMEDGILTIYKRSETEVEDEKIWETEIIKQEEEFTVINIGNCSSDDNCNPPKVIDLPDDIKFVENIPYTSEGVKIDTYSFNVDTNLETKKISVKRLDQENAGWSEDIYLKGFKTEPENKEETEEVKEGESLRYNTPFNIQVKTYPGDQNIKLLKFIKADNVDSNQIIKYNDKVHIVKADNPYEIGYFPVTGDGSRKLAFKNIISNDELINYSFYIKQKLNSEGNKKFNDGDNIKFNHEISISIENKNLTDNCGWWGCRVMKPSGYFSHGGTEIESIPLFRINEKPKENSYIFKLQDDGNIVLSEQIGTGLNKLWESNTNYKFVFNGFPNNLTTISTGTEDDTYLTCQKKCSEDSSCSAFLINECSGNDGYPLCTGKCTLYSGFSNPENGNEDKDNKSQKTYKKITALSQLTDISLDAAGEAAGEAVDNAKKTFNNLTSNLFGTSEETEGGEETEGNDGDNSDESSESASGITNNIIWIIILAVIAYLLFKRYNKN